VHYGGPAREGNGRLAWVLDSTAAGDYNTILTVVGDSAWLKQVRIGLKGTTQAC